RESRSDHLAALSELRRSSPGARLLARAYDARVLRSLGAVLVAHFAAGAHQRARPAAADPARRYVLLQAPRQETVHDLEGRERPAGAMEPRPRRTAAPAPAAAAVPLRRLR